MKNKKFVYNQEFVENFINEALSGAFNINKSGYAGRMERTFNKFNYYSFKSERNFFNYLFYACLRNDIQIEDFLRAYLLEYEGEYDYKRLVRKSVESLGATKEELIFLFHRII